jgi:hypothetical protein
LWPPTAASAVCVCLCVGSFVVLKWGTCGCQQTPVLGCCVDDDLSLVLSWACMRRVLAHRARPRGACVSIGEVRLTSVVCRRLLLQGSGLDRWLRFCPGCPPWGRKCRASVRTSRSPAACSSKAPWARRLLGWSLRLAWTALRYTHSALGSDSGFLRSVGCVAWRDVALLRICRNAAVRVVGLAWASCTSARFLLLGPTYF